MTESINQPQYTEQAKAMILKTQELHKITQQEAPKIRPDLQMKIAQQTATCAMELTGILVDCVAKQDLLITGLIGQMELLQKGGSHDG
jgi:hypothetical protein